MFLKTLKDKFKVKSGLKYLKSEIENPQIEIKRKKGISKVGCIVDLDNIRDVNVFYEFIEDYSLQPNGVKIIGYKSLYDKNSPYSTPVFSDKDLGWKGTIENSYVLEFLNREYDLLINYYTKDSLLMKLLTLKTKARIKVGFSEIDKDLNDLILKTSMKDFKMYKKELKKYLTVLNEIE